VRRSALAPIAVALGAIGFASALFVVGVLRYRVFRAQVDLGLFTQVVSSPLGGFSSTAEGGINHLAVHFSPILFLCSPLVLLVRTPLVFVAIAAVASALAIPAIYLLAARHVSRRVAVLVAFAALVYPPFISMTVGDFHELAFATPTILLLAWALDARRFTLAAVLALAALAIKEDVTLVLAALSLAVGTWAWRRRDRALARFCFLFAGAAALTFVTYVGFVRPALLATSPLQMMRHMHYYDWTYRGSTPHGFADLDSPLRVRYIGGVLGPLIAIPLATPLFLLAVPGLVEVLASHEAITLDLSTHYVGCWLPYVFIAFVFGVARIARRSTRLAYALLGLSLATSLWIDVYASPANWWYQIYRLPNARDALVQRTLDGLPRDASIGADLWTFAHLGFHPRATIDPTGASIVVVDRSCDTAYCRDRFFPLVAAALARHELRLASAESGIDVYTAVPKR
jgi:uncharacterized membrane protein